MLVLTAVQVILELKICKADGNSVQQYLHHLNRKSPIFGLALSVVLSIVTSMAFGAGGMIVLGSGLLSTVITQVYYELPEQTYQDLKKRQRELSDWVDVAKHRWYRNMVITLRTIRFLFLVFLLPFKMLFWGIDGFNKMIGKVSNLKVRI